MWPVGGGLVSGCNIERTTEFEFIFGKLPFRIQLVSGVADRIKLRLGARKKYAFKE
jgi:hypothetical protein